VFIFSKAQRLGLISYRVLAIKKQKKITERNELSDDADNTVGVAIADSNKY